MTKTERQKYKIAGPATWELIRAAYLGGESATTLAERFGVSVHAIRKRVTVEKWTKRDYALALEARGVIREKAKPNFIEEGVLREEMRVATEAREELEHETELHALVEQIASEEDAADIAAAIERRALAQAGAAMVQGRSKEAQALASMAEMMRKRASLAPPMVPLSVQRANDGLPSKDLSAKELERRAWLQAGMAMEHGKPGDAKAMATVAEKLRKRAEEDREAERAAEASEEFDRAQNEESAMWLFATVAELASTMLHQPNSAPAAFLRLIKRWRELNMGEGEEDADKRAAIIAEAQKHYFDGSWEKSVPEDVRVYLMARWQETRARLEAG